MKITTPLLRMTACLKYSSILMLEINVDERGEVRAGYYLNQLLLAASTPCKSHQLLLPTDSSTSPGIIFHHRTD